jgi:hypothetical protein
MPLYIRDDGVKELARRAALARRTNITEAVREALQRLIAEIEQEREARDHAVEACLARLDARADRPWTDADMYDDDGIPR